MPIMVAISTRVFLYKQGNGENAEPDEPDGLSVPKIQINGKFASKMPGVALWTK
jgi:hypothetical protein